MACDALHRFISRFVTLCEGDWQAISAGFTRQEVPASTLLLAEGQVCQHLWFVEKGLLRYFRWQEGEDATQYFTEAPYLFTSQTSFSKGLPSVENIETLAPSTVWVIERSTAYALLERPAWSEFIRQLVQEVQAYTEEVYLEARNIPPDERYRRLLEDGSALVQQVPLKHLASYLGIAPQSLSRIRRRLAKAESAAKV